AILDGEVASNMIRNNRLIGIRVRYPFEYRSSVDKLKSLLLTSPSGATVPMSSIADVEIEEGQTEIHRDNLRNMSAGTGRLTGRDLGSAMKEIQQRLLDQKSTRLNSSHVAISYAVFCLKKKNTKTGSTR